MNNNTKPSFTYIVYQSMGNHGMKLRLSRSMPQMILFMLLTLPRVPFSSGMESMVANHQLAQGLQLPIERVVGLLVIFYLLSGRCPIHKSIGLYQPRSRPCQIRSDCAFIKGMCNHGAGNSLPGCAMC
jgi:hypothetical protein